MKTKLIQSKITRPDVLERGMVLFNQALCSIQIVNEVTNDVTNRVFTARPFDSSFVGSGIGIAPEEILNEAGPGYKVALLVYGEPYGSNPVQYHYNLNGCTPISIPESWYLNNTLDIEDDAEAFCLYALHEYSHAKSMFKDNYATDLTHLPNNRNMNPAEYDKWNLGGGIDFQKKFYLHLINEDKQFLEQPVVVVPHVPATSRPTLKQGSKGEAVKELQNILGITADGQFGPITKRVTVAFQLSHNLVGDGIVGPKTWAELLKKKPKLTLIEAIIQVESNGNDRAIGDTGLKYPAYGPMQIRQPVCIDVNNKYKSNYKATDCLGNRALSIDLFVKYQSIYNPEGSNEEKARTWNGGPSWKKNPSFTDKYWAKVKALIE